MENSILVVGVVKFVFSVIKEFLTYCALFLGLVFKVKLIKLLKLLALLLILFRLSKSQREKKSVLIQREEVKLPNEP